MAMIDASKRARAPVTNQFFQPRANLDGALTRAGF
jgi:hypothetical protein